MEFDKGFENVVYNCDCLDLMREMVRGGVVVDWLITDPPYAINYTAQCIRENGKQTGNAKAPKRVYSNNNWDNERLTKEYFDLMFKVSKNQIIFGGNYYTDYLPPTKSWIVWNKRSYNSKDRNDFADCELAWCSIGQARVFNYIYKGMIQGDMKNKDFRFHPTQKPTQLITDIINYYTKENDLILDCFAGSLTTAECCYKTNRRYLCCEIDKEYFDKGMERLNKVKQQVSIFDLI